MRNSSNSLGHLGARKLLQGQDVAKDIFAKTLISALVPRKWALIYLYSSSRKLPMGGSNSVGRQGEGGRREIPGCKCPPWLVQTILDAV